MRKLFLILSVLLVLIGSSLVLAQNGDDDVEQEEIIRGDPNVPAPEFPEGLDWVNVPRPLSIEDLRGKVVVLDFWTYGCINCIHMIPVLEQLEAKYPDEVVVIGVHSAKFENEGQTDNLRQIVQRYDLHHPVINDKDFVVWRTWGVQAWPSFGFIDPLGNVLVVQGRDGQPSATLPGEFPFELFDRVVGSMVNYFDKTGDINRDALDITPESDFSPNTALAFPGKVLADTASNRLFITDSNHHRIVIADLNTYEVLDVIGTGTRGLMDGSFDEARFNKPQGLALSENTLYVADTNNHAIRAVDLTERTVSTVAGTGEQMSQRTQGGLALEVSLASPWDVEMGDEYTLYIAMAGPHQLWKLDLLDGVIGPLVGSGIEGLQDGTFLQAQLAQPSGLFYRDGQLYFADSESSSIRVADIRRQTVRTLAGPRQNNLFDFGDVDGGPGESRLQHALGVTGGADGPLYIADTYNSKIKVLDPETMELTTLFGLNDAGGGYRDGGADVAEFDEPGGLAFVDGKLYVADTNNQAIRVIDLDAGEVGTIQFPNAEALQISDQPTVIAGNAAQDKLVEFPDQTVSAGDGEIVLNLDLPEGYKLNDLAPFTAEWISSGEGIVIEEEDHLVRIVEPELPVRVPVKFIEGADLLHGDLTIYYCEAVDESLCFVEKVTFDVPVTVDADGDASELALDYAIVPPVLPE
ncbi:MAG: redoxin domain-containing protein [Anaerolineae bacterium]|nr:redoxin domain-containing protein [Anaerolineae bacterium]